ncbi:MAG: hypothetical protein EZS28_003409 [Streblomastix strix]|uniref:Uncharacterized protein n=1 Tax=Streblomastix strix TaxID=222440 RepID=A0A5J4X1K8_9EUKA|nr:MAG: hypothetical protein EZS28_003409 [Streblomastix strix]
MAKPSNTLNKQQQRTAGHSLINNSFRKSLQRAADNQSPNQIRQLYSSFRFKKAESNRHFNTRIEGDLPHMPIFELENNNITHTVKDKHNSRCSLQIVQIRRLSPQHILFRSNQNDIKNPTNSRLIRFINNKTISSIRDSEHKGLICPIDRRILKHMDEQNPVPYPWTVKPMPNQKTRHGKPKKSFLLPETEAASLMIGLSGGALQLLINRQRFETQRHYHYAMRTLAEFSYKLSLGTDQHLSVCPGILLIEVINWFIRQTQSASSTNIIQSCLKTIGGAIEESNINTLPGCYQQLSGNSTLSRSSIAQHLSLPFYKTLPVGQGIEPTDNTRARNDIIYIDQYEYDDMSRQQDQ